MAAAENGAPLPADWVDPLFVAQESGRRLDAAVAILVSAVERATERTVMAAVDGTDALVI